MAPAPAPGTAAPAARNFAQAKAAPRASLAGIACCGDLPEREGLGPPLEEELPAGHVLDDRFVIQEAIGRSGMATIYRSLDRSEAARSVAVKVPLRRIEGDPVSFGRFEREERIGLSLDDPSLLRFIPGKGEKSRPYIVTEFVDGCTLAYVIHRTRPVPESMLK